MASAEDVFGAAIARQALCATAVPAVNEVSTAETAVAPAAMVPLADDKDTIAYNGREFWEGKKISWRDGFQVLATLLRYRFTE